MDVNECFDESDFDADDEFDPEFDLEARSAAEDAEAEFRRREDEEGRRVDAFIDEENER